MRATENLVWQRMLLARMNKLYHQKVASWLRGVIVAINIVGILALVFSGGKVVGIVKLTPPNEILVALTALAIASLILSVTIDLNSKAATHQRLFQEFNAIEKRAASLNRRLELGESPDMVELEARSVQDGFFDLEGNQPAMPWYLEPLFDACDKRVRQEVGV